VSIAALRNQAEGLKASGDPFNEAGENPSGEQQLREARSQFAKMGQYTQRGGQQLSAEQRQSASDLGAAGVNALDALGPLANSGLIDPQQVGALLTKEIGGEFASQQQQRKISREINAIAQQVKSGRLTMEAGTKALADVHVEYGNAIYSNPAFAQFAGLEQEQEQARRQKRVQYAAQIGADPDQTTWNEKANRPVLDTQALQDSVAIQQFKDIPWRRDLEVRKLVAGKQTPPPKKADFNSHLPGREGADEASYQAAVVEYNKAQQARTAFLAEGVPGAELQMQKLYGAPQAPAQPATISGEELQDPTPQDLNVVEKQVRAGLKSPGWYIHTDGRKALVTGE
jgi:hypothetical protein